MLRVFSDAVNGHFSPPLTAERGRARWCIRLGVPGLSGKRGTYFNIVILNIVNIAVSQCCSKNSLIADAAWRPSAIAHTTRDCPRRASPAAKIPGSDV